MKITSIFLAPESSKSVRTGIKSSALGCLIEMLKIDPNLAFIPFDSSGIINKIIAVIEMKPLSYRLTICFIQYVKQLFPT